MSHFQQLSKTKKIINYFLFILFLIFAIIQLNDPDGILWFSIYFFVALLCLIPTFKSVPKSIFIITIIVLVAYALFHFTLFIDYLQTDDKEEIFGEMVYEKPYLEGSREFLGLLIATAGVWYQLKVKKKQL